MHMKKKGRTSTRKTLAFLLTLVMILSSLPGMVIQAAEASSPAWKDYLANISPDSAYVNFYGDFESRNASFIDGIKLGITDTNDPLYFEQVSLDGLEGRKQYSANSTYINVDDSFYEKGDNEFLVTIVFYNFGPSEGKYYLEYKTKEGITEQSVLIKPASPVGWRAHTVLLSNADLSKKYENGASLRIQNGAFNAWRRVEILNLSKLKREKKAPEITALDLSKRRDLVSSKIIKDSDQTFLQENIHKPCDAFEAKTWANKMVVSKAEVSNDNRGKTLTQGELIKMFMDAFGINYQGKENIIDYAISIGFIKNDSFFLFDSAPALNFHLGALLDDMLYYETKPELFYINEMFNRGFFEGTNTAQIENDTFLANYYKSERKNPYITITDNLTGRTFKYINFYGTDLYRPYLTSPQWLHDGKRFVCGTPSQYIYIYNIETQMMKFLVKSEGFAGSGCDGTVGENGMLYYHGKEDGRQTIMMVDPDDPELKATCVFKMPDGMTANLSTVSVDGTWFSCDVTDKKNLFNTPEGKFPIAVFDIPTQTYEVQYYAFPEYNYILNHRQANPVYKNLVFFAHETALNKGSIHGMSYNQTYDRVNIMDMDTGKVISHNQGRVSNTAVQLATHESWSADGEYLYFISWGGSGSSSYGVGTMPAVVRINKDGTHRQYYSFSSHAEHMNHVFASSDNKWACTDSTYVNLVSLETHQLFPITNNGINIGDLNHPYHPHAQVARGAYVMSWGHVYKGVLGVAWYDFTHIAEIEIPKGGREKFSDGVEVVSYKTLDCESDKVEKNGITARRSKSGKKMFFAVDTNIVDTTNDHVVITFDYFDNSKEPIVLQYTKEVIDNNDALNVYNGEVKISRKNTNKWKQAKIELRGNFESIGKYETDLTVSGGANDVFIANMKVEKVEK